LTFHYSPPSALPLCSNGDATAVNAAITAIDVIENHGVTDTFKRYIISAHNKGVELNEKYRVVETGQDLAVKAGEKAKGIANDIDGRYHVKDKLVGAKEGAQVCYFLLFPFFSFFFPFFLCFLCELRLCDIM